jgi:hypothetical protein
MLAAYSFLHERRSRTKVARPEGSEHAPPTFVIEGVKELAEALMAA